MRLTFTLYRYVQYVKKSYSDEAVSEMSNSWFFLLSIFINIRGGETRVFHQLSQ